MNQREELIKLINNKLTQQNSKKMALDLNLNSWDLPKDIHEIKMTEAKATITQQLEADIEFSKKLLKVLEA